MKAPIKDFVCKSYPEGNVTQWFGENPSLYRPWGLSSHNGIDIVAPHGAPIFAVEGGTVVSVKRDTSGFGKHIVIMTEDMLWTYGHLSSIHVVEGTEVHEGDQIGTMGNTGFVVSGSTPFWEHNPYAGTHLHLGCRRFVKDEAGWRYNSEMPRITILNYENGVRGAIDPKPFLLGQESDENIRGLQLTVISLANTVISLLRRIKNAKST